MAGGGRRRSIHGPFVSLRTASAMIILEPGDHMVPRQIKHQTPYHHMEIQRVRQPRRHEERWKTPTKEWYSRVSGSIPLGSTKPNQRLAKVFEDSSAAIPSTTIGDIAR